MGLDNVKNSPPGGPGLGPADTPSTGGPPGKPAPSGGPGEGQSDAARGLHGGGTGRSTRGKGPDAHPRVQDVLNEGKQKVQQLLNRPGERADGGGNTPPGQAKKLQDGGRPEGDDGPGRSNESHGHDYSEHGRRTQGPGGDNDHGRSDFRLPPNNNPGGDGNRFDGSQGRGPLDARGSGAGAHDNLNVASVVAYLRGDAGGGHVPRELRQVLDGASRVLGSDLVNALERRGPSGGGEQAVRFIEHALSRVARTLGRVAEAGGVASPNVPPRVGEAVGELVAATLLDKYFRKARAEGGRVVAQAEAALARLLYGGGEGGGQGRRPAPGGHDVPYRPGPEMPAPHPLEVLRDLQAGAFRPAEVSRGPFPLSGRALVANEMMELMRTLDAVDRVTRELLAAARTAGAAPPGVFVAGEGEEAPLLALLRALSGTTAGAETLDELLALLPPALPGRAARLEIPRLVAALGGVLVDADGRALVTKDGLPLKLDQLLWSGSLGGVLKAVAGGAAESFPVRLSPLLVYGFDAVYSLIGFDGRTLNPPHFAAVQAQVNGSELEWVFGQPPLSEGWMRALIERLKDSAQADHNHLGEMLEEALAEGRFHAALVGGTVSEGEARPDTFAVTRLLPGANADAAFSPA